MTTTANLKDTQDNDVGTTLYRGKLTLADTGSENLPNANSGSENVGVELLRGAHWVLAASGTLQDTAENEVGLSKGAVLVLTGDNPPQLLTDFTILESQIFTEYDDGQIAAADKIPFADVSEGDQPQLATVAELAAIVKNELGLVTTAELTATVSGLATSANVTADIAAAVSGLVTNLELTTAVDGLATAAELTAAVSGLATSASVTSDIAAAIAPLATSASVTSDIATAVAPLATAASVTAISTDFVTSGDITNFVTSSDLNSAISGFAASADVTTEIATAISELATETFVNNAVAPLATSASVTSDIATAVAPLATAASVTAIANDFVTAGDLAAAIPETVATQSFVTSTIASSIAPLATTNELNAAIANIDAGLSFLPVSQGTVTSEDLLAFGDATSSFGTKKDSVESIVKAGLPRRQVLRVWLNDGLTAGQKIATDGSVGDVGVNMRDSDVFLLPESDDELEESHDYDFYVAGVLANKMSEVNQTFQGFADVSHQTVVWLSDFEFTFTQDIPAQTLVVVHFNASKVDQVLGAGSGEPSGPTAEPDSFVMDQNTTLNSVTSLVTNDSDPDGDTLTIETTPVVAPQSGTLVINSNGTFSYTPEPSFVGTDSFTYRVSDGSLTDTAVVTITVNGTLSTSLAVTTNDMPALCHITPTNTGHIGDIIGEKWSIGGTVIQEDRGHILDLTDHAGTTVDIVYTAKVQSCNSAGFYEKSTTIQVVVPSWNNEWTLDSSQAASSTNFTTWAAMRTALASAAAKTIVRVTPSSTGKYDVANAEYSSLTSKSQICIKGVGQPVIDGGGSSGSNRWLLSLTGCSQIVFSNLTFENTRDAATAVTSTSATSYIIHRNVNVSNAFGNAFECEANSVTDKWFCWIDCNVSNTTTAEPDFSRQGQAVFVRRGSGIRVMGGTYTGNHDGLTIQPGSTGQTEDVIVAAVTASNNRRQGILVNGAADVQVIDNTCSLNVATGIQIEGSGGAGSNVRVKRNACTGNSHSIHSEGGIWMDKTDDSLVVDNICIGNNSGMFFSGLNRCVARNNFSLRNDGNGIRGGVAITVDANTAPIDGLAIYHTTSDENGNVNANEAGNAFNGSGLHVVNPTQNALTNFRFKNNILANCVSNSAGANNARQVILQGGTNGVAEFNHNLHWNEPVGRYSDDFSNWDFATWKTNTGFDANSINADPLLDENGIASPASPVVDAGAAITTVTAQSGTALTVAEDVYFFVGDLVKVNGKVAQVTAIAANVLTLSQEITATSGDDVTIYHPIKGELKNIGAI